MQIQKELHSKSTLKYSAAFLAGATLTLFPVLIFGSPSKKERKLISEQSSTVNKAEGSKKPGLIGEKLPGHLISEPVSGRFMNPTGAQKRLLLLDNGGSFAIPGHKYHFLDRYCLLYTSPSPRDRTRSRMPSSA